MEQTLHMAVIQSYNSIPRNFNTIKSPILLSLQTMHIIHKRTAFQIFTPSWWPNFLANFQVAGSHSLASPKRYQIRKTQKAKSNLQKHLSTPSNTNLWPFIFGELHWHTPGGSWTHRFHPPPHSLWRNCHSSFLLQKLSTIKIFPNAQFQVKKATFKCTLAPYTLPRKFHTTRPSQIFQTLLISKIFHLHLQ